MLGHKAATLTLDLYGHLFDDDMDPVADATNRGALEAAADCLRTDRTDRVPNGDQNRAQPA